MKNLTKKELIAIMKIASVALEHVASEQIIARELDLTEPEISRIYAIIQKSMTDEA